MASLCMRWESAIRAAFDARDRRRVRPRATQTAEIGACVWKELMPQPNVVGIIASLLLYIGDWRSRILDLLQIITGPHLRCTKSLPV